MLRSEIELERILVKESIDPPTRIPFFYYQFSYSLPIFPLIF